MEYSCFPCGLCLRPPIPHLSPLSLPALRHHHCSRLPPLPLSFSPFPVSLIPQPQSTPSLHPQNIRSPLFSRPVLPQTKRSRKIAEIEGLIDFYPRTTAAGHSRWPRLSSLLATSSSSPRPSPAQSTSIEPQDPHSWPLPRCAVAPPPPPPRRRPDFFVFLSASHSRLRLALALSPLLFCFAASCPHPI